jgi:hypothetical protein
MLPAGSGSLEQVESNVTAWPTTGLAGDWVKQAFGAAASAAGAKIALDTTLK